MLFNNPLSPEKADRIIELLGRAEAGLAVAVLIKKLDLASVGDGIRRIDPLTVEPVDLWLVGV